ncbi:MAG: TetR/AcrR family transcriptional regulator [Bacteroidota bacterium]
MSKRELNKVIIRERLLKEALRLFSEKGFEQTTVADIVAACEIGRGTFYNYFSDVKNIFDAVIDRVTEEVQEVVKEARQEATSIYELMYYSFKSYFEFASDERLKDFHRKNQAYIRSTSYGSESINRIVDDIRKDLTTHKTLGRFDNEVDFQLLSFVLVGAPVELFLNIHATDVDISTEKMATFLAQLFTKGISGK